MAEALVSVLLEQLTSVARREVEQKMKLVVGVDEEVRRLQGNLQVIEAVLEDAQKKLVTARAVEVWLKKVKDVSHEIENVLDAWNTDLIKAAAAEEEEEEEEEEVAAENAKKKVRSFISFSTCCFRPVQKLVVRHDIAHKIKDLNGRLDEIVKMRAEYGLELTGDTDVVGRLETTSFVDESEIYGRESEEVGLLNYLLGESSVGEKNPKVISILGMGGIGKTALAQLVFRHRLVQDHFHELTWVSVSNPFDPTRVAKAIIESIECQSTNMTELENLMDRIRVLILEKRFFLVLDDVWCEEFNTWEPFKSVLKAGAQGSRILVTTRKDKVMVDCDYTINLEVLSDEHCWLIISTMAFVERDGNQLPQLEDLGRELAHKCRGLPLAAKTLGSLVRDQKNRQKWRDILNNNLWELEDIQKDLLGPLLLSYHDLPSAMKQCFLYCSFFPKNYIFSRDELVYHWIAHGYISQETMDMENLAGSYFEKLAKRSLFLDFQKDNDDRIKKCKMHDIVHGFAQSMASSECFAIDVGEESRKKFKNALHLSLTLAENKPFPKSVYTAKDLRTFLLNLNGNSHLNAVLPSLFKHLLYLRALIMKNILVEKFPDAVENLIHLRLLNLSDSKSLRELPESMCNLCNLQTLDVSGCSRLEKLPQRMGKLINLRHLILDNHLQKPFPKGIKRLSSLRTLTQFVVGCTDDCEGCKLGELKNLNHLQGALTIEGLENVMEASEAEKAQLKKKVRLCHLSLSFKGMVEENRRVNNDMLVLKALEPHSDLETLEIISYKSTMYPDWIMSLTKLKRLQLRSWDKLERLPPLGNLPFLKSLEIVSANNLERVGVEFLGKQSNDKRVEKSPTSSRKLFPELESLTFIDLSNWKEWEWDGIGGRGEGGDVLIMPKLQHLEISNCQNLMALPNFLEMSPLQELNIGCFQISNWMMFLTSNTLRVLNLNICNNIEHLPPLGGLRLLEELEIKFADKVKKLGAEFLGIESNKEGSASTSSPLTFFPNLIHLVFSQLLEWVEWDGLGGMREGVVIMPRLQFLKIEDCPMLNSLPDFLHKTTLKELTIKKCPNLQQRYKKYTGEEWHKISHISTIDIS